MWRHQKIIFRWESRGIKMITKEDVIPTRNFGESKKYGRQADD